MDLHEDDPDLGDPSTLHSLMAHRINDHLIAGGTELQDIRPRDCPGIARTVANKSAT